MTLLSLVIHNVSVKKVRSALTVLAVAVGVLAVVTLGLINHSIRSSALALLQTGRADFTISQTGVSDIVNSNIQQSDVAKIQATPGVGRAIGVLLGSTKLNQDNPLFLEIGIDPADLQPFGVTITEGRAYRRNATHEALLGYRAADNLHKTVGDSLTVDGVTYRIVGLYSVGQALGENAIMIPLQAFQAHQRQDGEVTLVFVQLDQGANLKAVRERIDANFPGLTTIRTAADFGRADRSLQLINAADRGSRLLAIVVGGLIVMSMMTMAFIERIREFGVLAAVGWPRRRILVMVLCEAGLLGFIGAGVGAGLSVLAARLLENSSALHGIVHLDYTAQTFWRAIYTAAGMTIIGALYPAMRAAFLAPLDALRHE
ncbi:MAG TPA: ABC transporter permease [Mycobacteriales bacterium]|nr:ABC transporter permease [Mycobacteriales bacterium]